MTALTENKYRLKIGSKGEIYTTREIRKLIGLEPSSEAIGIITKDGLLIKPKKSLKALIKKRKPLIKLTIEEFEKLSEEAQQERLKTPPFLKPK